LFSFVINSVDPAKFAAVRASIVAATALRPSSSPASTTRLRGATAIVAAPPTRNGACPCVSGHRYKECHGSPAADAPALR
jgi:uncharacterized protein YecA (UPF0149 family)